MNEMPRKKIRIADDIPNVGISQKEVARLCKVLPQTIIRWEKYGLMKTKSSYTYQEKRTRLYSLQDLYEALFVSYLTKGGFNAKQIKQMLKSLTPPYNYDLEKMFWDIKQSKWLPLSRLFDRCVAAYIESAIQEHHRSNKLGDITWDMIVEDIKNKGEKIFIQVKTKAK